MQDVEARRLLALAREARWTFPTSYGVPSVPGEGSVEVLVAERDRLPERAKEEWYHADLIGLAVFDTGGNKIGVVVVAVSNSVSRQQQSPCPSLELGFVGPKEPMQRRPVLSSIRRVRTSKIFDGAICEDKRIVAALRETSILFGTLIAGLVLREHVGPRRLISAGLIACGAAILRLA